MNLSQFIKLMYKYVGPGGKHPDYVIFITRLLMRDPETDEEEKEDENNRYNPLDRYSPTSGMLNKIFTGSRSLDPDDAAVMLRRLNRQNFEEEIFRLEPSRQDKLIEELKNYSFHCTSFDLSETCVDIYAGLLEAIVGGKSEVTPEDINRKRAIDEDAVPLLMEVGNKCPLCQDDLIKQKKGKQLRRYKIVQIFPEDIEGELRREFENHNPAPKKYRSADNRIALCEDDAELYENDPTVETFTELVAIKKRLKRSNELQQILHTMQLREELTTVVTSVFGLKDDKNLEPLRMDPLDLEQKMKGKSSFALMNQVKFSAVHYFYFIQELFRNLERDQDVEANLIHQEVKSAYVHMNSIGTMSQDEMFERIAHWILEKLNLPDKYMNACQILVAYYVQDCEVFS